jgi:hypothetical protein
MEYTLEVYQEHGYPRNPWSYRIRWEDGTIEQGPTFPSEGRARSAGEQRARYLNQQRLGTMIGPVPFRGTEPLHALPLPTPRLPPTLVLRPNTNIYNRRGNLENPEVK